MEKTFEDTIRQFAGFTHVRLNMTQPLQMTDMDLEFKKLNLIVGKNGAGKSLLNKLNWVAVTFLNSKITEKIYNVKESKPDIELLQFMMDHTFDDQNFHGTLEFYMRDELLKVSYYSLKFEIDQGKVISVFFEFPPDVVPSAGATYISTFVRDFSNIERYLKMKNMLGIGNLTSWEDIEKLCQMFKIYDILALEGIIPKFESAGETLTKLKEMGTMGLMDEFDLVDLEVDRQKGEIYYYDKENTKHRVSALGAGEQSIIMMLVSVL